MKLQTESFQTGDLYLPTLECEADTLVHQGGTSSGKTYAILQVLFSIAVSKLNMTITVVGQDIPNLKVGALRDALDIYNGSEDIKSCVESYNITDRIFKFKTGSIIEFKSYGNAQDAKSGKRDYLFINEANGIPFAIYSELAMRTRVRVFIDYNPNEAFWVHENLIGRKGVQLLISDHRHNPFLSQKVRDKIEGLKEIDEELWNVYARGRTGKIEGLVFRNWDIVQSVPEQAELIANGLDFGFTNDPTAGVRVYRMDGELYVDQALYRTGLTNPDIAEQIKEHDGIWIADSAEPKSIEELRRLGIKIQPAEKGSDSVRTSIDVLKRFKIHVTQSSANLIKELNSYKWKVDRATGNPTGEPVDFMNHAIDALRYVALNKLRQTNRGVYSVV